MGIWNRQRRYMVASAILAGAMVSTGLAGSSISGAASSKKPIHVDAYWTLTGPSTVFGAGENKGATFAFKQVNAAGGIGGRKIIYTVINTETTSSVALEHLPSILSNKTIVSLLGPTNSGVSLAIQTKVASAGLPMLSIGGYSSLTHPVLKSVYRAFTNSTYSADAMVDFLKTKKHVTKLAILFSETTFGTGGASAVKAAATRYGMKVTAFVGYAPSATAYTSDIEKAQQSKPQAYVVWDGSTRLPHVLQDMRNLGISSSVPIMGPPQFGAATTLKTAGSTVLQGTYFQSQIAKTDPRSGAQLKFVKAWKKAFNVAPTDPDELGYSAASEVIKALKNVAGAKKPITRANVVKALDHFKKVPFPEANITYTPKTHTGYGITEVQLNEIKTGKIVRAFGG